MKQMTWTEFEALLAAKLDGFKHREIQAALAEASGASWDAQSHLLAQAGCGTGKSFVAAFRALMRSLQTGLPVGIATATKALQDQYAEKDLPFLAEILPGLKFAVLKGRSNYVCVAKVSELDFSQSEVQQAMDREGFSGEVMDLGVEIDPKYVTTTSEECPGKNECPFGNVCFAERAKEKAKTAHIVVANHAVVAADMAVKKAQEDMGVPENKTVGILPHLGGMIIDEMHEFGDSVTDALGSEVTAGSYGRLAKEIGTWFNDRHKVDSLTASVDAMFGVVSRILANRQDKRATTLRMTEAMRTQMTPAVLAVTDELAKVRRDMIAVQIHGDDKKTQKRKRLVRRIENASQKLVNLVHADEESLVRWLEVAEGKKGDVVAWAPLQIADFLRENLWSKTVVMGMSATLALGNDFSFMQEQLGLD